MNISVAIMAHPRRYEAAWRLFGVLEDMPFSNINLVLDEQTDEWDTGKRSLLKHGQSDWHIVLQDDAIVSKYFYANVFNAINAVPNKTLISLYTGTVRPHSSLVTAAMQKAEKSGATWLSASTLLWGVGISVPTQVIQQIITAVEKRELKYDRKIGAYFRDRKLPVYYTNPSLVDHDFTLGSLIGNDYAGEPRVARKFAGDELVEFNNTVEIIC